MQNRIFACSYPHGIKYAILEPFGAEAKLMLWFSISMSISPTVSFSLYLPENISQRINFGLLLSLSAGCKVRINKY